MARIRSIKPELRRDLTVGSWPIQARYAWVLLLGYLDDAGRGLDDLRLLVADLFPLDREVTEKRLDGWLDLMTRPGPGDPEGPLCRYSVANVRYLHAINWRHQKINRPTRSLLPHCSLHESSVSDHVDLTEGSLPRAQARVPADLGSKGARDHGNEGVEDPLPPLGSQDDEIHDGTHRNCRGCGTNPRAAHDPGRQWLNGLTAEEASGVA